MRCPKRWGFLKFFLTRAIKLHETMAEDAEREPDLAAIFEHSGDEGSFHGFEGRHSNNDSDSDVDLEAPPG